MRPSRKLPFMLSGIAITAFLAFIILMQPVAKEHAVAYTESVEEAVPVEVLHVYLQLHGIDTSLEQCEKALKSSDLDSVYDAVRVFVPIEQTVVKASGNDLRYLPAYSLIYIGEWRIFSNADEMQAVCLEDGELVPYPLSVLDRDFVSNGKKAIVIMDRGYLP